MSAEMTKVRDCDFGVDYTLAEMEAVNDCINQFDELEETAAFPGSEQALVMGSTQRLLKNMERRLLYSYKIPLAEATRKAFKEIQNPRISVDELRKNALPGLSHALLYNLMDNYCACKASRVKP